MSTQPRAKIGFYGGSFDPIHVGHLNLLIDLKEIHSLDEVWMCPTLISPFKQNAVCTSAEHRLEMVKLATSELPYVHVLDTEIRRKEVSYTIDTLQELSKIKMDNGQAILLYLMLGDDAIPSLPKWKNIDLLVNTFPLLIGKRLRYPPPLPSPDTPIGAAVMKGLTETALMDVSATKIRERVSQGLYCGHLIPAKVLDYIKFYHLYS